MSSLDRPQRVLVTGATGFIGGHVLDSLREAGFEAIGAVRKLDSSAIHDQVLLDLERPETILALRSNDPFDAIVHFGAQVGFDGASQASMYLPNVVATGLLAAIAKEWDAHLIYASAAIVCGARSERIRDTVHACPDTDYARTKYLGEILNAASGARYCNLRIGGVFGASGPSHLGLNRAIDGALRGEVPTLVGSGAALRNYVYVKDVADAVTFSLLNGICGTHLLAGKDVLSVSQMLDEICRVFLEGRSPVIEEGSDAKSQVIETSECMLVGRSFSDALIDIRDAVN